jgi:hypothetical protein
MMWDGDDMTSMDAGPPPYKIVRFSTQYGFTIVEADWEKHGGRKILVLKKDHILKMINNESKIDLTFKKGSDLIAEFIPTEEGWLMAEAFCSTWKRIEEGR